MSILAKAGKFGGEIIGIGTPAETLKSKYNYRTIFKR
jgi:hypothetical protein